MTTILAVVGGVLAALVLLIAVAVFLIVRDLNREDRELEEAMRGEHTVEKWSRK